MKRRMTDCLLILCALLMLCAAALASGVETDEDGGIWNYDAGTYTDPEGNVYPITPEGVSEMTITTPIRTTTPRFPRQTAA